MSVQTLALMDSLFHVSRGVSRLRWNVLWASCLQEDILGKMVHWVIKLQILITQNSGKYCNENTYKSSCCCCLVVKSCLTFLQPHGLQPARFLCPWDFPGKNTRVDCHFFLWGIFWIQVLNPCLLHWQGDSLPLSYQEARGNWKIYHQNGKLTTIL